MCVSSPDRDGNELAGVCNIWTLLIGDDIQREIRNAFSLFQWQLNSHLPAIQRELRWMDSQGFSAAQWRRGGLTQMWVLVWHSEEVSRQAVSSRLRQSQSNHQGSLSADYRPFCWVRREASCPRAKEALFARSARLIWRFERRSPSRHHSKLQSDPWPVLTSHCLVCSNCFGERLKWKSQEKQGLLHMRSIIELSW